MDENIPIVQRPLLPAPADANVPQQPSAPILPLNLSQRIYWLLALTIVAAYLLVWLTHFRYIYGWIMDDRVLFFKGMATVNDWRGAFAYDNALQTYFFLISYLPLKLGISLPSYPVPTFGDQTGQFRFFLLWMVFLHAILLIIWAWFTTLVTDNRLASLLSLLLFTTSPTLTLWSPQPESRLVGLPFILAGIWLLLRMTSANANPVWTITRTLFTVGSLFGLAQALHYTSLYLIAPVCLVFWILWLRRRWRQAGTWSGVISFGFGCLWLQGILEYLSYFLVGIPWEQGPTMTLLRLRNIHTSAWSALGNLSLWFEWFFSQMGFVMLAAIIGGWIIYLLEAKLCLGASRHTSRLLVGLSIPMSLIYLALSGTMPFFRQTSVLQPFLFLFAGIGIVGLASYFARRRALRLGVIIILLGAVGSISWGQAYTVFQAHQSLGRALEWAYTYKGDRTLKWFPVAWFGVPSDLASAEELGADPDAWLISYFPWSFIHNNSALQPYLERIQALASWPSLYATDTMWAELKGFGYNDFRHDPVMRDIRVVEAAALIEANRGVPLSIKTVGSDSIDSPAHEAVNVFDQNSSPDNVTGWLSANTPNPHFLEIQFAQEVNIGEMWVVLPPTNRSTNRIGALEIQVAADQGAYRTVWFGHGLEKHPSLAPRWEPAPVASIKLIVHEQTNPQSTTNQSAIEEVVFPGYRVIAPAPQRTFPELALKDVRLTADGLVVSGLNVTHKTVLMLEDVPLSTRLLPEPGQLLAPSLANRPFPTGQFKVYLADGFRRSNTLPFTIRPLVLRQIDPAATQAGQAFNLQPDGQAVLSIACENAAPGTTVIFDGTPLTTFYGGERWLTAFVPRALYSRAGRYEVYLKQGAAESNRLTFAVDP